MSELVPPELYERYERILLETQLETMVDVVLWPARTTSRVTPGSVHTVTLRCQLMHFFENINFYIVIPPSKYDNKEILRLQGSVEGPKILRFRFL